MRYAPTEAGSARSAQPAVRSTVPAVLGVSNGLCETLEFPESMRSLLRKYQKSAALRKKKKREKPEGENLLLKRLASTKNHKNHRFEINLS